LNFRDIFIPKNVFFLYTFFLQLNKNSQILRAFFAFTYQAQSVWIVHSCYVAIITFMINPEFYLILGIIPDFKSYSRFPWIQTTPKSYLLTFQCTIDDLLIWSFETDELHSLVPKKKFIIYSHYVHFISLIVRPLTN